MSETIEVDYAIWESQNKKQKLNKIYFWSANVVALIAAAFLFSAFDTSQKAVLLKEEALKIKVEAMNSLVPAYVCPHFPKPQYTPEELLTIEQATYEIIQNRRDNQSVGDVTATYTKIIKKYPTNILDAALKRAGKDSLDKFSVLPLEDQKHE